MNPLYFTAVSLLGLVLCTSGVWGEGYSDDDEEDDGVRPPSSTPFMSALCSTCIASVIGGEGKVGVCEDIDGTVTCGPYQLTESYWIACGQTGQSGFESCAKEWTCSENCVRDRMNSSEAELCARGRAYPCHAYSMYHFGGPEQCRSCCSPAQQFAEEVDRCVAELEGV